MIPIGLLFQVSVADARYARKFDTKQDAIDYLTDNLKSEMTTIVEVYGFR